MEERTRQKRLGGAEENYQRTKMQEEMIFQKLKERGCRITKQRQILLNIILQEECASCKEIYYKAKKEDARIGAATVYRMINLLEEIGAISRKHMYTLSGEIQSAVCRIVLDDHTVCRLSPDEWYLVMTEGLRACGYIENQNITDIILSSGLEEEE